MVLKLITDNQAGIPLHIEALNRNSSDKTSFRQTIATYIGQLQNTTDFTYLVMDSAGYTQKTIAAYSEQFKWISRVPETLSTCQVVLTCSESLRPLIVGYHYRGLYTEQAGVRQRWLLVFSEEAYQREVNTLNKTVYAALEYKLR